MQITDRSKDVIKSGGEWISSIELENAAVGCPGVAEAAAIGIAASQVGRAAAAGCVVASTGCDVCADKIREHLASQVAKWWLPDAIEFVDELPHTATGKILEDGRCANNIRDYRFADARGDGRAATDRTAAIWAARCRAHPLSARPNPATIQRNRDPMAAQYSYVMKGLTKTFPGAPKPVLNGIHLQFYPDAKIGIVGPNGSGKSTLMKIMAGRDNEFVGEAWPGEGITVGYLEQEPQLDRDQDGQGECHATASARSPT